MLVLERDVRVQCRQRVRLDAGLLLHFSCRRLECCFAWLALPAEILPVAVWSDASEPSLLADEEETNSGEVDVGCLRGTCVDRVSSDVGVAVCVIHCACWVRCVVARVLMLGGLRVFLGVWSLL